MIAPEIAAAIHAVKARYCRMLDTKDWDGFADVFTEDIVMDVTEDAGAIVKGRADVVAQVRWACDNAKTVHQVSSPEITVHDAGNASCIWAMQDRLIFTEGKSPIPPVIGIKGYGHYHETYRRCDDGAWRIATLKLTRLIVEMERG
jgi:ketosteroid isomerase-like protein